MALKRRDYNRDPNIKALKRRRVINHGSTSSFHGLPLLDLQDPFHSSNSSANQRHPANEVVI